MPKRSIDFPRCESPLMPRNLKNLKNELFLPSFLRQIDVEIRNEYSFWFKPAHCKYFKSQGEWCGKLL